MDKTYGCGQARASCERCILMGPHDANDVDGPGSKHLKEHQKARSCTRASALQVGRKPQEKVNVLQVTTRTVAPHRRASRACRMSSRIFSPARRTHLIH